MSSSWRQCDRRAVVCSIRETDVARFRLTKIYTRTGDDGTTGLGGGQRVEKDCQRIETYGTVDELNSVIGVAAASNLDAELVAMCKPIQNDLFDVGSDLCILKEDKQKFKLKPIDDEKIKRLEGWIDTLQESLGPLENFILPGGTIGSAQLHVARCVCRRAERCAIRLAHGEVVGKNVVEYLNRLSDLLFVMARFENFRKHQPDVLWDQKA